MTGGPVMRVDLDAIEHNARTICRLCADHGIEVTGVTKVTCGMPSVARALLRGGVTSIGESRLENIHRMRADGITAPFWLLRIPPLSEVEEIVTSVNISLNSEIGVIRALSAAAEGRDLVHDIILMVDLGDLREGLWPDDVVPAAREIADLPGVRLRGLGTNLTCYGGVLPSRENMRRLVDHRKRVEDAIGREVAILSGGNSSSLDLLRRGEMPEEINHLRLGESLMLGKETAFQTLWPGARPDAFVLSAELIEVKDKPSLPVGERGRDAFGRIPDFEDRGPMLRGILNVGREDVTVDGLSPRDPGVSILGASSDHLLVDISTRRGLSRVGDELSFLPDYGALLAAMTSAYVRKEAHRSGEAIRSEAPIVRLVGTLMDRPLPEGAALAAPKPDPEPGAAVPTTLGELLAADLAAIGSLAGVRRDDGRTADERELFVLAGETGGLLDYLADRGVPEGTLGLVWLTARPEDGALLEALDEPSILAPGDVAILGLRDAGRRAREVIARRRIAVRTMEDIDLLGMRQVMRSALHRASGGTRGVVLRYDATVCDGGNEGLTRRETYLAMELASRSGLIRGIDISGALPAGSPEEIISLSRYAAAALGRKILG